MSRKYYQNISFRNRGEIFASKENMQANVRDFKTTNGKEFVTCQNFFINVLLLP